MHGLKLQRRKLTMDGHHFIRHVCPDAAKQKVGDCTILGECTPLHAACLYRSISYSVVSELLSVWPDAAKEKNKRGLPLHSACYYKAPLDVVLALLSVCPDAAKEKDSFGRTPLHLACDSTMYGTKTSMDVISTLLGIWPDAAKQKDQDGDMPLHKACHCKASLDIVSLLLGIWPDATK
eukprot:1645178-Ditylum_brightwellii.AAC.1